MSDLPTGWTETNLGEVVELKRGYDLPKRLREEGDVPIISSSGLSGTHNELKVDGPGVVTGRYGTIGELHWVDEDYWPLNTALYVRDFKGNDRKFIYYFLQTIDYFAYSDKAAVPGVNRNHLHKAEVRVPPIEEQRAIASILGALDDKIELNRRMNATLESLARAIFKSWFVDFDPVKINAGQMPASSAIPTTHDPKVLDLFPSTFQDSKLGMIPDGWTVKRIEDIATKVATGPFGSRITKNNFVDSGVPVIRGNNLTDGFNEDRFAYLTEAKADDLKTANVFSGDIVFTHRGTLGQVGFIPEAASHPRYVVSQSQMYLRVDPEIVSPKLVYLFFRNPVGQHALLANKSQVGVPAIARPTTSLKNIRVVIPLKDVSDAFVEATNDLYAQFDLNSKESSELASTRDTLLPRLLSGQIEAPLDVPPMGACAE